MATLPDATPPPGAGDESQAEPRGRSSSERGRKSDSGCVWPHPHSQGVRPSPADPLSCSSSLDVGFALLSAVALVALTSAVEAGFRAWKAAQRRKRHRGRPPSLMSPAASAPSLPKLLGGGGTASDKTPRALPEGEYLPSPRRGARGLHGHSPGPSTPPSDPSTPEAYRAQKPAAHAALRQLPTIPSAAELQLPLSSPQGSSYELPREDDWAAAVARGEAWTKSEPWATLWRKSAQFAAEEAAQEAAMLRAEQLAAEEAHWAAVADRQKDMEAAARAGPPAGWANAAAAAGAPPSLASMSASALAAATAGPGHNMTQAELELLQHTAAQEAAQERAIEESVRIAYLARVGQQLRASQPRGF